MAPGVDLVLDEDSILIRPDRSDMTWRSRRMKRSSSSTRSRSALHVLDEQVRHAIQRRGELWRICPLPQSPAEMMRMIRVSRIAITARPIYYYNSASGSRLLTCGEFLALGQLGDADLRGQLAGFRVCRATQSPAQS